MGYTIHYWSNQASEEHPLKLSVAQHSPSVLLVGSNADNPGPEPVGTFRAPSTSPEGEAFVQSAWRLVLAKPNPVRPALPGEVIRRLSMAFDGRPVETRLASESSPADSAFSTTEAAALALVKSARRYPQAALSLQCAIRPNLAGRVDVSIRLSNVGIEGLSVPHPDVWKDGGVLVLLTARRNDVPLAQLRNEHQRFLNLSAAELVGTIPALPPARIVVIRPQQELSFKFSGALMLPSGGYDLWLSVDMPLLDERGVEIMRVEATCKKEQYRVP